MTYAWHASMQMQLAGTGRELSDGHTQRYWAEVARVPS